MNIIVWNYNSQISSRTNFVGAGLVPAFDKIHFLNSSNLKKQGRSPRGSKIPFAVWNFQQELPIQSVLPISAEHNCTRKLLPQKIYYKTISYENKLGFCRSGSNPAMVGLVEVGFVFGRSQKCEEIFRAFPSKSGCYLENRILWINNKRGGLKCIAQQCLFSSQRRFC